MFNHPNSHTKLMCSRVVLVTAFSGFLVLTGFSSASVGQERGGFDVEAYIKRLDTNRNGRLEPNEISGRTESWLKREGFDTDQPVPIDKVLEKFKQDRERRDRDREDRDRDRDRNVNTLKVPAFGATDGAKIVPGFGPADVAPLSTNFSDSVLRQVDETMERYDRNGNGMLDAEELRRARWGSPRPEESDTNKDGRLSRTELSNRYYIREQHARDSEKRSGESNSRDRSESSSRFGRRSDDRGSIPSSSSSSRSSSGRYSSSSRSSFTRTPSSRTSSASSGSSSSTNSSASREKFVSYAESLIKNYDEDEDGKLSKDEVKKMRRPPVGADADNDGFITKDELIDSLSGANKKTSSSTKESSSDSSSSRSSRSSSDSSSSRSSYRSSRSSSSFSSLDANGDNHVEMHEFADEWDDEKIKEYYEKDKNGDGVITSSEWNDR